MDSRIDDISIFTPSNCSKEFLEKTLIHGNLADNLGEYITDSITSGSKQSHLVIGPRGSGKSHLLAVLFNRINENEKLRDKVTIAFLKEEERGVATFLDWLVKILEALVRRNNDAVYLKEELDELTKSSLENAEKKARQLLIDYVGDRTLLLVTENLNDTFSKKMGMGKPGQSGFRDLVQEEPFWVILASAKMLFEDIQKHNAPFYGFFRVYHLEKLSPGEAYHFISNIAFQKENDELASFIHSEQGKGRVRAAYEITGGNPRLLAFFYRFLERESLEAVEKEFNKMVEDLTSYYQEKIGLLSSQQCKMVEFLAEKGKPVNVKTTAKNCFMSQQTASSQLKKLLKYKFVNRIEEGRESYYELTEPLFRIYFEVKKGIGKSISMFMDFLGKFYTVEELKKKHEKSKLLDSEYQVKEASPQRTELAGKTKPRDTAEVLRKLEKFPDALESYKKKIEEKPDNPFPYYNIPLTYFQMGNHEKGFEKLEYAVKKSVENDWLDQSILGLEELNIFILENITFPNLKKTLKREFDLCKKYDFLQPFADGYGQALFSFLKEDKKMETERLRKIVEFNHDLFNDYEEFTFPVKFFKFGVKYISKTRENPKKARSVLLGLPKEQRNLLTEILGIPKIE